MYQNEEDRRRWQNPEKILSKIGLKAGSTFIDIGCGNGVFALQAAKIVGTEGKVYGVDSNSIAVQELKKSAASKGLRNLHIKVGKAEETVFCERCADIVFFGIVLHDFNDPNKVLKNASKMIKIDGRLINLDWKKEYTNLGPPYRIRLSVLQAKNIIEAAGFCVETFQESGNYHYMIVARLA